MSLEELKLKATASELTLIEAVEKAVTESVEKSALRTIQDRFSKWANETWHLKNLMRDNPRDYNSFMSSLQKAINGDETP